MNILFADKFPADYLDEVSALGHDFSFQPELDAAGLASALNGFDTLVVRSTRVTAEALAAADVLKLVIRAGAGTNTIDKKAAAERDIYVCNVPGKNALAVAELTLGLILSIDRNIPDNVTDLRGCSWNKKRYSEARGLYGQRIGVVGLGAIGIAVAERAAAFGMQVLVIGKPGRAPDMQATLERIGAEQMPDLDTLAAEADILSFHVPASDDTRHLVNQSLLDRMRPGSMIINTSRGDVVDETALIYAMNNKGIRAGLDVYADEPAAGEAAFDSALAKHPNVYGTHHIGASTAQAQSAVAEGVVEILQAFPSGTVLHCVNR